MLPADWPHAKAWQRDFWTRKFWKFHRPHAEFPPFIEVSFFLGNPITLCGHSWSHPSWQLPLTQCHWLYKHQGSKPFPQAAALLEEESGVEGGRGRRREETGGETLEWWFPYLPSPMFLLCLILLPHKLSTPLYLQLQNQVITYPGLFSLSQIFVAYPLFSNLCYRLGPGSHHTRPGNCQPSPKWPSGLQMCAFPVIGGVSWPCSSAITVNGPLLFWDNIHTLFLVLQGIAKLTHADSSLPRLSLSMLILRSPPLYLSSLAKDFWSCDMIISPWETKMYGKKILLQCWEFMADAPGEIGDR